MKRYITVVILIILTQFGTIMNMTVNAQNSDDAIIRVISDDKVFSSNFQTEIEIQFLNKNLYNKDVYVSYHIYDKYDKELLFEGLRLPIKIDEYYKARVKFNFDLSKPINIDSTEVIDYKKNDYLKIKFDMVDQHNIYWYRTNKDIKFNSCEVVYESNFIKKFTNMYKNILVEEPISFSVNMIFCIASVYFLLRVKNKYYS